MSEMLFTKTSNGTDGTKFTDEVFIDKMQTVKVVSITFLSLQCVIAMFYDLVEKQMQIYSHKRINLQTADGAFRFSSLI